MKIILAGNDKSIRDGIRSIINECDRDWEIVAEAKSNDEVFRYVEMVQDANLLILDTCMPGIDEHNFARIIQEKNEKIRIIVISDKEDYKTVRSAFLNGSLDYILKKTIRSELVESIERIKSLIVTDERAEEYRKKSKNFLMTDAMIRLLKGNEEFNRQSVRDLEELGVNIHYPLFMVFSLQPDRYYKQYYDLRYIEHQLNEYVDRISIKLNKREGFDFCCCIDDDEVIVVLFCDTYRKGEVISQKIYAMLSEYKEQMETGSVGISGVHREISEIQTAYMEAKEAIRARFYLGHNKKIRFEDISDKFIEIQYDLEPVVNQVVHYIEMCDYIKCKEVIERLFLDLSYCRPDKFRKYMRSLVGMFLMRIKDFDNVLSSGGENYEFQINYLNTYRELKIYMNSIIQGTIEYIKGEKEKRSKKRIELAKAYIEQRYKDQITLNDVAEYVELNSSYFSNLFKVEVGMNFSDYLLNIRMENAKKLLTNPKIKVYEIGNSVGYEDAVSFGRAFKKKVGMSPKEYRNSVY